MNATTSTATARPPYGPPVRRVAFGAIEPQGHRVGLFGPGGIGKTTLAATAPGPVGFIDLDDSLPILRPMTTEDTINPEQCCGCDVDKTANDLAAKCYEQQRRIRELERDYARLREQYDRLARLGRGQE